MEETLVLHYGMSTMEIIRTLSNNMKNCEWSAVTYWSLKCTKNSHMTAKNHNQNYKSNQLMLFTEIIAVCCENLNSGGKM